MSGPLPAVDVSALGDYVWQIGAIVVCFALLAFSSLSEAALVRAELGRARHLAGQGDRRAGRLLALIEIRQEVLATLILLINLSIIVASAYATEITIGLTGGESRLWVAVTSVAMIALLLVFCEVTPKTYAMRRAEAVALVTAPVVAFAHRLVGPVGRLLHAVGIWVIRRIVVPVIGGEALAGYPVYSAEEMMELVTEGEANGSIEEEEREMIAGVIEFADMVAREVMTPRTDMVWVSSDTPLVEAARISEQSGFSRLPVCDENVDNVVGILYAKDMVSALGTGGGELTAGQVARKPAPVIPESKKVGEVFRLMQRNRLHQAVVIDEYGGTSGIVTIEDLLEEIFGEIRDEHDTEAEPIRSLDERTAVVDARVAVAEIREHFGVELPEGEFDSVGGFILHQLGRLPAAGERIRWRNLEFIVEAVGEHRIRRVRVMRAADAPGGEGHEGPMG